jgi:hypothetical protein
MSNGSPIYTLNANPSRPVTDTRLYVQREMKYHLYDWKRPYENGDWYGFLSFPSWKRPCPQYRRAQHRNTAQDAKTAQAPIPLNCGHEGTLALRIRRRARHSAG